jgi:uncharacterized membrane protein
VIVSELWGSPGGRAVVIALVAIVAGVTIGLWAMWPDKNARVDTLVVGGTEDAEVVRVDRKACPLSRRSRCQILQIRLRSGPNAGTTTPLTFSGTDVGPAIEPGDRILVFANDLFGGAPTPGVESYSFVDFERRNPIYLLAAVFAVLVVAFARWKGVRSLLGLVASLALVTQFIVPAILEGASPLAAALVGSLAVMLVTVALSHGAGVPGLAAVLGATVSLLVTASLAVIFVELAQITGFASEEATLLRGGSNEGSTLSLEGLVLAGIVVAALGVLDDVTISQASTVVALRRANPAQTLRRLFGEALTVGRDHLSATVNTLVLAYVGAALPILLIFENQGTSFSDALNREVVATEVVAMLVGSIGIVLAVPLTTALAAWLTRLVSSETLAAAAHAHPEHHH